MVKNSRKYSSKKLLSGRGKMIGAKGKRRGKNIVSKKMVGGADAKLVAVADAGKAFAFITNLHNKVKEAKHAETSLIDAYFKNNIFRAVSTPDVQSIKNFMNNSPFAPTGDSVVTGDSVDLLISNLKNYIINVDLARNLTRNKNLIHSRRYLYININELFTNTIANLVNEADNVAGERADTNKKNIGDGIDKIFPYINYINNPLDLYKDSDNLEKTEIEQKLFDEVKLHTPTDTKDEDNLDNLKNYMKIWLPLFIQYCALQWYNVYNSSKNTHAQESLQFRKSNLGREGRLFKHLDHNCLPSHYYITEDTVGKGNTWCAEINTNKLKLGKKIVKTKRGAGASHVQQKLEVKREITIKSAVVDDNKVTINDGTKDYIYEATKDVGNTNFNLFKTSIKYLSAYGNILQGKTPEPPKSPDIYKNLPVYFKDLLVNFKKIKNYRDKLSKTAAATTADKFDPFINDEEYTQTNINNTDNLEKKLLYLLFKLTDGFKNLYESEDIKKHVKDTNASFLGYTAPEEEEPYSTFLYYRQHQDEIKSEEESKYKSDSIIQNWKAYVDMIMAGAGIRSIDNPGGAADDQGIPAWLKESHPEIKSRSTTNHIIYWTLIKNYAIQKMYKGKGPETTKDILNNFNGNTVDLKKFLDIEILKDSGEGDGGYIDPNEAQEAEAAPALRAQSYSVAVEQPGSAATVSPGTTTTSIV